MMWDQNKGTIPRWKGVNQVNQMELQLGAKRLMKFTSACEKFFNALDSLLLLH